MKRANGALCALVLASVGMMAEGQQLPNLGFNSWVECGNDGDAGKTEALSYNFFQTKIETAHNVRPGSEPDGWNGSSVNQSGTQQVLVSDSEGAVQLQNLFVGYSILGQKIGSTAPGFLTFGTPWVFVELSIDNCDGGTYGGINFTHKPDAIKGMFKREDGIEENSHIIAYLWNGEYISKIGPKNLKKSKDAVNVDRAIMGRGESTQNGQLVASCDYTFASTNGWQQIVVPLTYTEGAAAPTMANVIISAGDYWERGNLKENTTLMVDDVDFVYYSRLKSLKLNGVALDGFSSDNYVYTVYGKYDWQTVQVEAEAMSPFAEVQTDVTEECVEVTITNQGGADVDGETSHTYTVYFAPISDTVYPGYLNIEMDGEMLEENTSSEITISEYGNGLCSFLLPDLTIQSLDLALGDIVIDNVKVEEADGSYQYTGSVADMVLKNGEIHAKVDLIGTVSGSDVDMTVAVVWYVDYPVNTVTTPISVNFTSAPLSSVEGVAGDGVKVYAAAGCVVVEGAEGVAQVYTADGKQVAAEAVNGKTEIALANGLYIVRVGNKVQKVVVK